MESLEKAKTDLSSHFDGAVVALAYLNRNRSNQEQAMEPATVDKQQNVHENNGKSMFFSFLFHNFNV